MCLAGPGEAIHPVSMRLVIAPGDDHLQGPPNHLFFRVSQDARRGLVPADDVSRMIGRDDGIDRGLGYGAELLLRLLSLADVPDNPGVITRVFQEPGGQGEFDGKLTAALVDGGKLDRFPDDVAGAPGGHPVHPLLVALSIPLGDDQFERPADHFLLGVTEKCGGGAVP